MLYDKTFLASLPEPQPEERRPLINLKSHNSHILDSLNGWYKDLLRQESANYVRGSFEVLDRNP